MIIPDGRVPMLCDDEFGNWIMQLRVPQNSRSLDQWADAIEQAMENTLAMKAAMEKEGK